ncbi:MAG TPA: aspartyl protease family protein [Candidatus Cybelea sp.]|nr:aspartyl protease family protein [Candidatus Cybelea sp.]
MYQAIALFTAVTFSAIAATGSAVAAPSSTALDPGQIDKVLASAHAAAGGAQLDAFAAVTQSGSFTQNGGPPSTFTGFTDLQTGYSRNQVVIGPATFVQGYDGTQWTQANGSLSIVSLPSFVADAVTQAYLSSNAFFRSNQRSTVISGRQESDNGQNTYVLHLEPTGGSPVDLYFDATSYRLVKQVAQTAEGLDTTTNSDFQVVQGVPVAMRNVDVNSSGTTTSTTVTAVKFLAASDPAALARPPYVSHGQLAAPTSIPMASDASGTFGHVVVPVTLDGKNASLIFDSGGGNFLLPDAARRLGLHASGGIATGGAGSAQQMTAFAPVSTVDFGGARLLRQNFVVTPLSYPFSRPRKDVTPEGLIGAEYLANFRIAVRYADNRIDVAPFDAAAPAGGVTLPFKSDGAHSFVLASVDGVSGYYLLDTGNAGGVVFNLPFVQEHHLFPNGGLTYASPGGVGGGFHETIAAAKSFTFAGNTFANVPIAIPQVKSGFFATRGVSGNLGSAFLSRFTVVFDYKAQTVTFIPNRNLNMPFRSDRVGWSLNQSDATAFEVRQVVPGSPAAKAGLAIGDRITAFAGKQVSAGYGLGDLAPYSQGTRTFKVTIARAGASRTMTLTPRYLLPTPQ